MPNTQECIQGLSFSKAWAFAQLPIVLPASEHPDLGPLRVESPRKGEERGENVLESERADPVFQASGWRNMTNTMEARRPPCLCHSLNIVPQPRG